MEFKFRAVDENNKPPPTTSQSVSPITYLPDRSLPLDASFSGLQMPLSGEAALRREIEKELIRREILRRMELEEEVRRELAMEKELGISMPRPLMNIQGLMSHWSNSTMMNPAAVAHIDALQSPAILPPAEVNPSPEISDKDKVIVLDKPDPDLFNAKRKATAPPDSEIEPLAFSLKKKSKKEEWSCALCEIKTTSESGLNAHLNGKKHKAREAGQNRKIARNKQSEKNVKAVETDVTTTKFVVDAEKDQQLLQPCTALEVKNKTAVDKGVEESKKEEQLEKTVADNDASATESKNEKFEEMMVGKNITELKNETVVDKGVEESKKEEQLVKTVADNDASATESKNEKFKAMMVGKNITESKNETVVYKGVEESKKEEQLVKMVADNDASATKSKNEKFEAMMVGKDIPESKNEEQLVATMADNSVMWKVKPLDENELEEMMVSNDVIKFGNGEMLVEKRQNVGSLESKKDPAMEEAEKINALTKMKNEEQSVETMADNSAIRKVKPANENELVEMMVSNDAIKFENGGLLVEKTQNVGSLESKIDAAMEAIEEAEKITALTKKRKVEHLRCEICQINTFSKVVMERHVKGKKHIKKMKKLEQNK